MNDTTVTASSLSIFHHLFASVAEEMGVTLERTAFSPNIKERLDFSCAIFLGDGRMLAQAAHIPVHLGAMPASVQAAIKQCSPFQQGDVVILNDPYQGGNHLPDITMVSPIFLHEADKRPIFFVTSRAHHADVGGMAPGSMPLSTEIYQEGIIIPPIKLITGGIKNEAVWSLILRNVRTPDERDGDLSAQLSAHKVGENRLHEIIGRYTAPTALSHADALIEYADKLTRTAISHIPNGTYSFTDYLEPDIPISVEITADDEHLTFNFAGTSAAIKGNLNTVPAVAISAVAYCIRCLALDLTATDIPMNEGAFTPLSFDIPEGCLLNPRPPHAVAAGNVETSQRIVDVIFGALAQALPDKIPAASQGTMNNLAFGGVVDGRPFAYYETIGGGCGAGSQGSGASGQHAHMSNTLNTPIEALEHIYPIRVKSYTLRRNSGGKGIHQGGDGVIRAIEFLAPVTVTLTTERRIIPPYGIAGGQDGMVGVNKLIRKGKELELDGKVTLQLNPGDILHIETPGGGGWGK